MATERPQKSGKEILDALERLSLDSREEILAMSPAEVQARLEAEGIDISVLRSRTKKLIAQTRLSIAGEQRRAVLDASRGLSQEYADLSPTKMRAYISERLQRAHSDASYIGVLFNRFKDATDEDLPGILEALLLLDQNVRDTNNDES